MAFKKGDRLKATLDVFDNVTGDAIKNDPTIAFLMKLGGITSAPQTCSKGDLCTFDGIETHASGRKTALLLFARDARHGTKCPNPSNEGGHFHVPVEILAVSFTKLIETTE